LDALAKYSVSGNYVSAAVFIGPNGDPINYDLTVPGGSKLEDLPGETLILRVEGPMGPIELQADGSAVSLPQLER